MRDYIMASISTIQEILSYTACLAWILSIIYNNTTELNVAAASADYYYDKDIHLICVSIEWA